MSAVSKFRLVIIWEHELRAAARALKVAIDGPKEGEEGHRLAGEAFAACYAALWDLVEDPDDKAVTIMAAATGMEKALRKRNPPAALLAALDADKRLEKAEAALREIMAKVGRADECGRWDAVGDFHECDDQKPREDWCSVCIARAAIAPAGEGGAR